MPHSEQQLGDGVLDTTAINGQLATPSLSPISEHGSNNADIHHRSESKARKLSSEKLHDLTTSPDSLPLRPFDEVLPALDEADDEGEWHDGPVQKSLTRKHLPVWDDLQSSVNDMSSVSAMPAATIRPGKAARSMSSPSMQRRPSSSRTAKGKPSLAPIRTDDTVPKSNGIRHSSSGHPMDASPMVPSLPLPPPSLPTYLQLELSSDRPSPLYIRRSAASDIPYESSQVKFERLVNFFTLPKHLEQVLLFGAIACLDAWMYTFTILPLRFFQALLILLRWIGGNSIHECADLGQFVFQGVGRLWQRWRHGATSVVPVPPSAPSSRRTSASESESSKQPTVDISRDEARSNGHITVRTPAKRSRKRSAAFRHRRTRSTPSALLPNHKADLLQGLLIICSCTILMWFDASRMYHAIRGQAAIKLYVIYNLLEVFDRLFAALGQDVLECLCSKETLERGSDGRSKVLRPLGMFLLALAYNVMHATALFYQAITLNVAVNSYSNALLTLLMSNQFVEIKGTVFKKFEKENLFQLTCADIVERFQLWLMLSIIALRNIVEVGGLSISLSSGLGGDGSPTDSWSANGSGIPLISGYVIPQAFTLLPKWTGEVLGPFVIVLGSEALVDWCKHAYINKFNNVKPRIYGRFLDVLAKDYYSHAFVDQNLTKRLGLPVIPLSCLFIRSCMQTYHMFLATHMPPPIPSPATSISLDSQTVASSPATTAALQHIDRVFRRALGRSTFGAGTHAESSLWWSLDDFIAFGTMVTVFLAGFLVLLALKLLLGMLLLSYARNRYKNMKEREKQGVDTQGRRVGGWGAVEVGEEKRRWIYEDDPDALDALHEKERRGRQKVEKGELKLDHVERYTMSGKRIW